MAHTARVTQYSFYQRPRLHQVARGVQLVNTPQRATPLLKPQHIRVLHFIGRHMVRRQRAITPS